MPNTNILVFSHISSLVGSTKVEKHYAYNNEKDYFRLELLFVFLVIFYDSQTQNFNHKTVTDCQSTFEWWRFKVGD